MRALKSPQALRLFPEKLFYKIGEVSEIVGVEPYVLRYWETEFPFLSPRKTKSGQRIYTKKDIDLIVQIKRLLYEEKYTIDGARRKLSATLQRQAGEMDTEERSESKSDPSRIVSLIKERLRELLGRLS